MDSKSEFEHRLFDKKHTLVSLIGDSGIQFLDYELDISKMRAFQELRFHDRRQTMSSDKTTIVEQLLLHAVENRDRHLPMEEQPSPEDRMFDSLFDSALNNIPVEETYTAPLKAALEIFDRQWLPVPYYRSTPSGESVEEGPSNWARIFIAKPEEGAEQDIYRIVIGFDTELCEPMKDMPYAGPSADDCSKVIRFQMAQELGTITHYSGGIWQRDWIKEAYLQGRNQRLNANREQSAKPRTYTPRHQGEHLAHYVTLVSALHLLAPLPSIRFVRGASTLPDDPPLTRRELKEKYIDVDLVLDIGNSRTCGLLVEFGVSDERASFGAQPPAALQLRQIERPHLVSDQPFESRVEFHPAKFGKNRYGRRSQRPSGTDAFWWPSPVRIGKEASWLATQASGRDGTSGMSSPKRFVWDQAIRPQAWVNNVRSRLSNGRLPPIAGPIVRSLRSDGQPRRPDQPLSRETAFSRGSIYMLMISELICHALVQINSPEYRYGRTDTDLPRRLRKIVLTLPSATPLAERDRMRAHARNAIKLVWQAYRWDKSSPLHPAPELMFDWDEATCGQLVYLYNELEFKFLEAPKSFFQLYGRKRATDSSGHSLRIASIDIGGGTTDLMVVNYTLNDRVIVPQQLFREGVRLAGDDVLKRIIETILLPTLVSAMQAAGVEHANERLSYLFSGDSQGINREDQVRRGAFVNQVLIPAAIRILNEYEKADHQLSDEYSTFYLADVIDPAAMAADVPSYLNDEVRAQTGHDFDFSQVQITMRPAEVSGAATDILGSSLQDFCDVIRAYQCDLLLVTGRSSGMIALREILRASAPVEPHRIVPMYGYRIGNWYPFRSEDSRLWDPKTTASVGAMLCHLLSGDYGHFVFDSSEIQPKSTARYLGRMNQSGRIPDDEIIFENTRDDDSAFREFDAIMTSWLDIGYRQLPYERWPTAPLYRIQFRDDDTARRTRVPAKLKLQRVDVENAEDESELARERFDVVEAEDRDQISIIDDVYCKLRTFRTLSKAEAGYWIDSGVLDTSTIISGL